MTTNELERLIEGQTEHPGLDFKSDSPWDVKKLAKDMLAMANVRDGGYIVIGVQEKESAFLGIGVSAENLKTYVIDEMKDQLLKYADPSVEFSVKFPTDSNDLKYVVIRIFPFKEVPVICKRDFDKELRAGTLYYRNTNRRVESAAISNSNDLRDVLEIAAIRLMQRRQSYGYSIPNDNLDSYKLELGSIIQSDIIKEIKSRGYTEVNFIPLQPDTISSLAKSLEIVKKAQVRLNWDLPWIPNGYPGHGTLHPADSCYEAESDMGSRKEFWRMYLSQQFYMINSLTDDWYEEDNLRMGWAGEFTQGKYLTYFTSVIHYISQIFAFLERLALQGLYKNGVRVSVVFYGTQNRELYLDTHKRVALHNKRITRATKISLIEDLSQQQLIEESTKQSNAFILKVLDHFGYNPSSDSVQIDQLEFLNGR